MPFKSDAQRRKFAQLVADGKMSQETFNRWESETKGDIPERAHAKGTPIKKVKKIKTIR